MLAHAICFYKPRSRYLTTLVFWCISGWVRQNEQNVGKSNFLVRRMCSLQLEKMLTKEEMLRVPRVCVCVCETEKVEKLLTELCWVRVARFQTQLFHNHSQY